MCDGQGNCRTQPGPTISTSNPCEVGTCDPATGAVSYAPKPTGTACTGANLCASYSCDAAGSCSEGAALPIASAGPCTVGACNPATGAVTYRPVAGCSVVPPDPILSATPVNPTVASDIAANDQFLYSGTNPIQVGVAANTITPVRASVVSGTILQASGTPNSPLAGVAVTVLGHPEYGVTWSRRDGAYDLVVNGGGPLVLQFGISGYVPAQRHVSPSWRNYEQAVDVVMTPFDTNANAIGLGIGTPQVAQGSMVSDADGTRQTTLLVPTSTRAHRLLPNGSTSRNPSRTSRCAPRR